MEAQENRSALDEFARQTQSTLPVIAAPSIAPARLDIPHGAIQVQEKRNRSAILAELRDHAAMLGDRGYYRWEVKNNKKGTTDIVEGVTIKGANALVRAYRNCHVSCPIIVDLGTHWRFHAVFVDYENGIEMERSFMQRKSSGGTMGDNADRRTDISYQVGISKAERNVVLNVLDMEADFLLEECKQNLVRKIGMDLERWRGRVAERLAEHNIEIARAEHVVGRGAKNWLAPDVARVISGLRAIAEGMALADDVFPPLAKQQDQTAALDQFAKSSGQTLNPGDADDPSTAAPEDRQTAEALTEASAALRQECIDKVLKLAGDKDMNLASRVEALDLSMPAWQEQLADSPAFLEQVFDAAIKVARNETKPAEAKKFLEAIKGKPG